MVAWKEGLTGWEKQEGLSRADGSGLCLESGVSYKGGAFTKTQRPAQIRSVPLHVQYTSRKIFYVGMFYVFL